MTPRIAYTLTLLFSLAGLFYIAHEEFTNKTVPLGHRDTVIVFVTVGFVVLAILALAYAYYHRPIRINRNG